MSASTHRLDRSDSRRCRFGSFEVDLKTGELRKRGLKLRLSGQPFEILRLLLESPGEVVTREELRDQLWTDRTFVDFDHGLNAAINKLRETLGDSVGRPRYIETLPRRGYRFIGRLDARLDDGPLAIPPISDPGSSAHQTSFEQRPRVRLWMAGVPLLVLLGAIGLWAYYRKTAEKPLPSMEVVPLVGLRGFQVTPAFSPDGNQVAFRDSDGAHNTGIYTTMVGGEKSLRLTSDPGDCCPAWSPDGRQIAWWAGGFMVGDTAQLMNGAAGRQVSIGPAFCDNGSATNPEVPCGPPVWSPDGRLLFAPSEPGSTVIAITVDGSAEPLIIPVAPGSELNPFGSATWQRVVP
jgi:DNA-binding winged helix-turn-helix (wHTH) protein